MRRTTVLTLCLLLVGVLPAMAQLEFLNDDSEGNDPGNFGKISTDFNNYAQALQQYIRSNLPNRLAPIEQFDTKDAMEHFLTADPFRIPDPFNAQKEINEVVRNKFQNNTPDPFENNLSLKERFIDNELNRELTRGVVQGVMGENAQLELKSKLESIEKDAIKFIADSLKRAKKSKDLLEQVTTTACDALSNSPAGQPSANLQACQNATNGEVQRDILRIQGYQTKIQAETFAQTIQMNQSQQYSNLNLANISQQMEEANRARRVDSSAETARLLRATSQIGLFVDSTKNTELVNPSQNNL